MADRERGRRRRRAGRRWRRFRAVAVVVLLLSAGGAGAVLVSARRSSPSGPPCVVAMGRTTFALDREQATQATTIAVVAAARRLPARATTIAIATALRESSLRNLRYGDRDSLGLFQQRPSQGWGTPAQLVTPTYASGAFYDALLKVRGWQSMSVNAAAQRVQRSGDPNGYTQWEDEGRALAAAFTGERPASFTCRPGPADRRAPALRPTLAAEMRGARVGVPVDTDDGWAIASWLLPRAGAHKVQTITFAGRRWSASTGRWETKGRPRNVVVVTPSRAIR